MTASRRDRLWRRGITVALCTVLLGCANAAPDPDEPPYPDRDAERRYRYGTLGGEEGIALFGGGREEPDRGETTGIGVNSFLWRATLDTISFMPVASADPFGGVILTDWYTPASAPNERFKLNIYILDRQLRADGVRVAVFRQTREPDGGPWIDAPVDPAMGPALEETILTRARELRVASLNQP